MKVVEKQPLKHLKKTLFLPETSEEKNKQVSPIGTHEEESPTNPKKNCGQLLGLKNIKNLAANNVVQKHNVPTKKGATF
jgi:hypothetical protein